MNKQSAVNLVKSTFENSYNRDRFLNFSRNLFHSFEPATFIYRGNYIPDAYKKQIKTLERIGKYEDKDKNKIDILAVCLNRDNALERARTLQRNFISWYLNGSRGDIAKDAALVAFYVEGSKDWRLSLVKMEYRLGKSNSGKIKTFTELTPAKRFSFLVGENENTHTAQRQLLPSLINEEYPPSLTDLEKIFNVEVVTKEFFEKYKQLFLDTREALDKIVKSDPQIESDFKDKNIDTVDFTKKLLGQIVFLYFLQKKGWFGVARDDSWGSGPKEFLRLLFEKNIVDYNNYFNDILEPLFYEALAIERPDDFYSRFDCKIPFLNGGLFDPLNNYDWVHTDIRLPNQLFSNDELTKEGDHGTGILDVFDRYNFTVKEDEPLEREVAVDPEMLGKVFENLLEVKDRKSKGTYYTPREIVHYMCQESLVNYLATELGEKAKKEDIETLVQIGEAAVEHDTRVTEVGEETDTYSYKLPEDIRNNAKLIDDALENIRVCDPAVGSGAFLVGMMTEVIRVRNTISSYLVDGDRSIYAFKHHAIQHSLYGVDIDPGAVEIAKLRLWLSLIVDEQDIKKIKPLPNLDYKIMQGNSLLEEFEGIKLFDESFLNTSMPQNDEELFDLKRQKEAIEKQLLLLYQKNPRWMKNTSADKPNELLQFEAQLNQIKLNIKRQEQDRYKKVDTNQSDLFGTGLEATKIKERLHLLHQNFFNTSHKNEKDQIKKQIESLTWELIEATLREQGKESLISEVEKYKKANIRPFFLWKLNFSEVFESKGGFDVVIANPPYIDSESMVKNNPEMRESILKTYKFTKGNWDIYIAFFELAFNILDPNGSLTFITPDKWISKPFGDELRRQTINNIYSMVKAGRKIFESAKVDSILSFFSKQKTTSIKVLEFKDELFLPIREVDKNLLSEPYALDYLFSDYLNFLIKLDKITGKLSDFGICENACATSDAYKLADIVRNLTDSFDPNRHLKIINTGTIGKYYSRWGKQEMTYLGHKYLFPIVYRNEFLGLFKNSYAKKSLQPKIIMKGLNLLDAVLDLEACVIPGKSTMIFTSENVDYLKIVFLLLNSELPFFYFKEKYPAFSYNQGTTFTKDMINSFPFPHLDPPSVNALTFKANEMLELTQSNDFLTNMEKQQNVKILGNQIGKLFYDLYDLSQEEISIVEDGKL